MEDHGTIQMASGATFGASPVTSEGRIIGAIATVVGTASTGIHVSIIAVWGRRGSYSPYKY